MPADLVVLMLVNGSDGTLRGTGQTVPDPKGAFRLDGVASVEQGSYVLSVDYGGVFYGATLASEELTQEVVLTVYEPTQDIGVVEFEQVVMVLADVDESDQVARATEFVQVANNTDRTLRPDLAQQGVISFMRFALPPGAGELTVQSNLRGGDVISIGTGFALTAPVPPGSHSVDYSYTFPYQSGGVSYRQSLPQGADIFQVLAPREWSGVGVSNLTLITPVLIQDTTYNVWEIRGIPPGPGVQLEISGLPQPGAGSRLAGALSGGAFWQVAIPSALGAALAVLLVWGVVRRSRPLLAAVAPMPEEAPGHNERRSLVFALATLDQRYESGAIPEGDYLLQREELVARALGEINEPDDDCR